MLLHACVFAPRERFRNLARAALPRRQWRLTTVRRPERFAAAMRIDLVDATLVDLGAAGALTVVAPLARDMPLIPFLGFAPFGVGDAAIVARAAELGFAEVLAEGVDESVIAPLAGVIAFTSRFAASLHAPPSALGLTAELQLAAWRAIVAGAGRTLTTNEVARRCSVSREHLSRTFAARDAPTLKEAIDLVRLLSASQLAKCPAYDLADVARLLGFTSPSQLSRMARRVLGRGATSLPRLRGDDLIRLWARTSGVAVANSQGT